MTSLLCCASARDKALNVEVIPSLDLDRYMGKWYEIARLDHSFERGLDRVTAEYIKNTDGTVKVVNRGYRADGTYNEAIGKAKTTADPGVLKVSFFWIFYAPYRIFVLDEAYQYALVGSNSANYLWILCRQPTMDKHTLHQLLEEAQRRGFDTSKLIFPQPLTTP